MTAATNRPIRHGGRSTSGYKQTGACSTMRMSSTPQSANKEREHGTSCLPTQCHTSMCKRTASRPAIAKDKVETNYPEMNRRNSDHLHRTQLFSDKGKATAATTSRAELRRRAVRCTAGTAAAFFRSPVKTKQKENDG